ncbi:MAG: SDR family NAD(P)-dependent oxidoreductase [Saprospiraceae bacterium]|nr:SDR family NAD(P)-dependent oxidoreductase [Saprospiraceae bacterium]
MKTGKLVDKVAIVSGSSQGIGKAIARGLCQQGVQVVLNGREAVKLQQTKSEFQAEGHSVTACTANIRFPQSAAKLVNHAIKHFGKLDIVVCNAGVSSKGTVEDSAASNFKILVETNYLGSVYLSKYAIPYLKQTRGHIILINSVGGMRGMPYNSAYTSSKMAQTALGQALQVELYDFGIHVGILYVGFTINDPNKKILDIDGSWHLLPRRTNINLTKPESVAYSVIRMIHHRRKQATLTILGHFTYFMTHFLPRLSHWVAIWSRHLIRDQFTFIAKPEEVKLQPRNEDIRVGQNKYQQEDSTVS